MQPLDEPQRLRGQPQLVARRVHRVVKNLHPALVDYKGLTRYRDMAVEWLSRYDDGAETSPGGWPD